MPENAVSTADENLLAGPPPPVDVRTLPVQEQLARAFTAAFNAKDQTQVQIGGRTLIYHPGRLFWNGDKAVMIAPASGAGGCVDCAGTVGVCCALALQRDGHRVTLIDLAPPARGCSYGNGGLIQTGSVVPIATPGVLRQVPRMLLDPDQPLVIRWQYLPRLMPYLLRFVAAARPKRVEAISTALASVLALAGDAYRTLLASAGAEDMIRPSGEGYPTSRCRA